MLINRTLSGLQDPAMSPCFDVAQHKLLNYTSTSSVHRTSTSSVHRIIHPIMIREKRLKRTANKGSCRPTLLFCRYRPNFTEKRPCLGRFKQGRFCLGVFHVIYRMFLLIREG